MGSVNKVTLVGNLGRDPEIRSLSTGERVAHLRVATSETWRDRASGERKERTEWHQVVVFNENLVKVAESILRKGMTLYIEGALQNRQWTDGAGVVKYATEVVLQTFRGEITIVSGKGSGEREETPRAGHDAGRRTADAPKARDMAEIDDENPF